MPLPRFHSVGMAINRSVYSILQDVEPPANGLQAKKPFLFLVVRIRRPLLALAKALGS